jgi:tetratricopeptide (TPR) repeat protein
MEPITVILLNKGSGNLSVSLDSANELHPQQIILGTFSAIKPHLKEVLVIDSKNSANYSSVLNELQEMAKTDWILYLKDNERILQFNEHMPNLVMKPQEIYGFQILQDDVIIKEVRLWNKKERKVSFKNPVFEKPNAEPTQILDVILYQQKADDPNIVKNLDLWKRAMPLSVDVHYYRAFMDLAQKNFLEFKRNINQYFFSIKRVDIPSVMARYYLSLVQGVVENHTQEAITNIVACLAENPLMAEFWCLLGDIFVKGGKFDQAITFYENAMILGCRRPQQDFWPMHISKYTEYPTEMIEKCKAAISHTEIYETRQSASSR